jgi:hypothetical protein
MTTQRLLHVLLLHMISGANRMKRYSESKLKRHSAYMKLDFHQLLSQKQNTGILDITPFI